MYHAFMRVSGRLEQHSFHSINFVWTYADIVNGEVEEIQKLSAISGRFETVYKIGELSSLI